METTNVTVRTFKLWHLAVAFLVGGAVVGGVAFAPGVGTQGLIKKDSAACEKLKAQLDKYAEIYSEDEGTAKLIPKVKSLFKELQNKKCKYSTKTVAEITSKLFNGIDPDSITVSPSELSEGDDMTITISAEGVPLDLKKLGGSRYMIVRQHEWVQGQSGIVGSTEYAQTICDARGQNCAYPITFDANTSKYVFSADVPAMEYDVEIFNNNVQELFTTVEVR